ncbi:hypothetical protein [Sphingobium fluviale]|uniref:hypothetical protein n=1 Tax=Sphingobium fluviale TaxID=2506423 RepID=UPI0013E926A3|nr:hypothetical protein [Sphingobium fluviale]
MSQPLNSTTADSGFDDRVRDGCGLLVAAALIAFWVIGGALLVNWLAPLAPAGAS